MDEAYGRFGSYSRVEVERFLHLDDEDRRLVADALRPPAPEASEPASSGPPPARYRT